jgi:hypothetical protein
MMPSQKLGNETPKSDTAEARVSHAVSRRTAARVPRGTATRSASASAPPVNWRVGPSRSRIRVRTGSPVLNERPRSPRTAASTQLAYWAGSGRSRPRRWRTCAATSCENSPPMSTASGPPGARRISAKRMTETPASINAANPSRFAM